MNIYERLTSEIKALKKTTPNFVIGKTQLNKDIVCFKLGKGGGKKIIVQGGMHAREYITSFLLIEIIKYLKLFAFCGQVYIIPLINPDGVNILSNGTKNIKNKKCKGLIKSLLKYFPQKTFKANAHGVDLNTNFDAHWGKGKQNNLYYPSAQNFVGFAPNSEKETQALINFTKKVDPFLTLSYHSKGNVIYYGFKGQSKETKLIQKKYLKLIARETNYKPLFTKHSGGGYKDWCLLKCNIIGFTIEIGNNHLTHPISLAHLKPLFKTHKNLILEILKE